jgi:hypothetical protein
MLQLPPPADRMIVAVVIVAIMAVSVFMFVSRLITAGGQWVIGI